MLNVCIIDDGIDERQLGVSLTNNIKISEDGIIIQQNGNEWIKKSHGTLCACIILKYSPDTLVSSIKLKINAERASNSQHLITALQHCLKMDINVIHMSLGSTIYSDFSGIHEVIRKLAGQGKIIVAACSNRNIFSVPACLLEVICVCTKRGMEGESYEINKNSCDGINYIASSRHMIDARLTPLSNSCAAPLITAKVCQYLSNNPKADLREIRSHLNRNAENYSGEEDNKTRYDFIRTNHEKLDCFYGSVKEPADIDNPVVCIYDYPPEELIKLKNSFINSGYNCLVVTNILQENFLDTEYINFRNERLIKHALKALNTVYSPDLLIIGIYRLPELKIANYIHADLVCRDGMIMIDESKLINMKDDLFGQLYSILGGNDA